MVLMDWNLKMKGCMNHPSPKTFFYDFKCSFLPDIYVRFNFDHCCFFQIDNPIFTSFFHNAKWVLTLEIKALRTKLWLL